MRFDNVILNFDGTLVDSADWFLRALNESADHYGYRRVSAAEWDEVRGRDSRAMVERLGVPRWRLLFIARRMRRHAFEHAHEIRPFAGVPEALDTLLRRGASLAIVSSNGRDVVRRVLGDGLCDRFAVMSCEASFLGKGAKLRRVARRLGARSGRTVYVGDEVRDVEAATFAGVRSASVGWGYSDPSVLFGTGRTLRIERVADLASLSGPTDD